MKAVFYGVRRYIPRPIRFALHRKDLALWQSDVLFVQNSSPLVPSPRLDSTNW